ATCVGADCGVFRGSRVLLRHRFAFPPGMDESSDQLRGSWSASMNESTLTQLKIIVERAVRPVRASTSRKRKMREELLAHVVGVLEEEAAKPGPTQAAVERTARRFGNPAEVTGQLQGSIPASDVIVRFCEGRPGEPVLRGALRSVWFTGADGLVILATVLVAA